MIAPASCCALQSTRSSPSLPPSLPPSQHGNPHLSPPPLANIPGMKAGLLASDRRNAGFFENKIYPNLNLVYDDFGSPEGNILQRHRGFVLGKGKEREKERK